MNGFRLKPTRGHITITVALIGAAVTLGFAIWQSQKGKHQVPAIIDNQHVFGRTEITRMAAVPLPGADKTATDRLLVSAQR
jgi:hypothetical protein